MENPYAPIPRSPSPIPLTIPPSPPPPVHLPPSPADQPKPIDPIPWRAFLPVILFRIGDALNYSFVFPIITDMVTSFGVPSNRIGLYAGLGEGIMMLVEALAATTWARLADKYGRKPCIVWGFALSAIATPLVGFSGSVWQLIFWRAAFGLTPLAIMCKIIASEISTPSNRAKIFSIFSPSFYIGLVLGTFLGGELAHPYGRLPGFLGGNAEIWRKWPFALPSVVVSVMNVFILFVGWAFVPETRPPVATVVDEDEDPTKRVKPPGAMRAVLQVPHFIVSVFVYCCFQIATFAYDGVFGVYTYTEVERGGLGLPVDVIGVLYTLGSTIYVICTPFLLPIMQRRYGNVHSLALIFGAWPIIALLIPVSQWTAANVRWAMWPVLIFQLAMKDFGNFAWPLCDVLIMSVFDDFPHLLATGSAVSLVAGAGGRALGPAASGWIYSISTQYPVGTFGRQISWLAMLVVAIPPVFMVHLLPRDTARPDKEAYEAVPLNDTDVDADLATTAILRPIDARPASP